MEDNNKKETNSNSFYKVKGEAHIRIGKRLELQQQEIEKLKKSNKLLLSAFEDVIKLCDNINVRIVLLTKLANINK